MWTRFNVALFDYELNAHKITDNNFIPLRAKD